MENKDLAAMAKKMPGEYASNYSFLENLNEDNPDFFKKIEREFKANPTITKDKFTKIISKTLQEDINQEKLANKQYAELAKNSISAINNFARLAQIPELNTTCRVFNLSVNFAEQFTNFADLLKKPGFNVKEITSLTKLTNFVEPITGLITFGLQIALSFGGNDEPSFEELLAQQLEAISKQIENLEKNMNSQFKGLNEHLDFIRKIITESITELHVLIALDNKGLREYLSYSLDKVLSSLAALQVSVEQAEYNILQQRLIELKADIHAVLNDHPSSDLSVKVAKIANKLEQFWILSQSASKAFNGVSRYDRYKNDTDLARYQWEKQALILDDFNLNNLLGYLVSLVANLVPNLFSNPTNAQPITIDNIVNPHIFNTGVSQYLSLREKHPRLVIDDQDFNHIKKIISLGQNTLEAIHKIQNSEALLNKLFEDYLNAIVKIEESIEQQVDLANSAVSAVLQVPGIDLRKNLYQFEEQFYGRLPKNIIAKFHIPGKLPDLRMDYINQYNIYPFVRGLPRIFKVAEVLKLGEMQFTYSGIYTAQANPDYNNSGYNPGYSFKVKNFDGSEVDLKDMRMYGIFVGKMAQQNKTSHLLNLPPFGDSIPPYMFKLHLTFGDFISCHINCEAHPDYNNPYPHSGFSQEQWNRFAYPPKPDPNNPQYPSVSQDLTTSTIVESFSRYGQAEYESYNQKLAALKTKVESEIVALRKKYIIAKLLANDSAEFSQALDELDAVKNRILAICTIAGIKIDTESLLDSKRIRQGIEKYKAHANIDDVFFDKQIFIARAQAQKEKCLNFLRANRAQNLFAKSNEYKLIASAIALLNLIMSKESLYNLNPSSKDIKQKKLNDINVDLAKMQPDKMVTVISDLIICADADYLDILLSESHDEDVAKTFKKIINAECIRIIHLACYLGDIGIVKVLLKYAENGVVNQQSRDLNTPLLWAVKSNNLSVVKLIYEKIADNPNALNHRNKDNKDARQLAIDLNLTSIVEFFNNQAPRSSSAANVSFSNRV